jgi:hypothetical protein
VPVVTAVTSFGATVGKSDGSATGGVVVDGSFDGYPDGATLGEPEGSGDGLVNG